MNYSILPNNYNPFQKLKNLISSKDTKNKMEEIGEWIDEKN